MRRNIELRSEQKEYLLQQPAKGIGYHFVHVSLKNGTLLKNRIVINSLYLLLEEEEYFSVDDISGIVMKENS